MRDVMSRRDLLSGAVLKGVLLDWLRPPVRQEDQIRDSLNQYFRSPMHSYPLLQEMPWDMLVTEAERLGISVEGRNKNDIARDIFQTVENCL